MKAVIYKEYGPPDVLKLADVNRPEPKSDEILIRVHAATVTSGDARLRALNVPAGFKTIARLAFGIRRPRKPILGSELAGEIVSVGRDVTNFKPGDEVFAMNSMTMGGYAEYKALHHKAAIAIKPSNLSYEEAAALSFGGTTAIYFLNKAKVKAGDKLLIIGASGGVGTATVQLAKQYGAEVTGVCSTSNVELVRSLGADYVIDYTKEDFALHGVKYDIIMDTVGTYGFPICKNSLRDGGRFLMVAGDIKQYAQIPRVHFMSNKKVIGGTAGERTEDLRRLAELAERGQYKTVIDKIFPLSEAAEAHRYVDTGRKRGNVVLKV